MIQRFREIGSVADKPRSGRPSLEEDREATIAEELQAQQSNPELGAASCRSISRRTDVPKTSVQRILRQRLCFYPYRLQTNQALSDDDKERRVTFALFLLSGAVDLESILWTDESYFSMAGHVNRHNCIVWGSEKPREVIAEDIHAPKVCVWFGYSAQYRLTPFFFPGTVTGENYTNMLRCHVMPQIRRKRRMDSTIKMGRLRISPLSQGHSFPMCFLMIGLSPEGILTGGQLIHQTLRSWTTTFGVL